MARFGGRAFGDVPAMLDASAPDVAIVAVPPYRAPEICGTLVARRIPFLTEKPLAALDRAAAEHLVEAVERTALVVAVGYHLRGIEPLAEVRERLLVAPPTVLVGRWLDATVASDWWPRAERSGGQLVEQATHLFDMARLLAGEATVVGATAVPATATQLPGGLTGGGPLGRAGASTRHPTPVADIAAGIGAVLRFDRGAIGAFAATRVLTTARVGLEVAAAGLLVTIRRSDDARAVGRWEIALDDGSGERILPLARDPYEVQDETFLRAVDAGDPSAVLSTPRDALATDALTRAVVAASGVRA